ncbi:HlyD family secretion protein [Pseudomonas violetae]|uniref:HlyD family secretion protein n=1 Tax=Pseudomonas violetae TaxID=2915813 RepID=A0ABT0ESW5_9PSED|nr:HlyD family secretion protein [Pseudomonas violetae]MCK1788828.1 HlyD family secretion protein [Pseudomonas violetae]
MSQTEVSKKPFWGVAIVLLVLALGVIFWRFVLVESPLQSTNDAFVSADFTLVAPKVSGFIDQVLVEDNQQVKAGEVLARIDPKDYQADLAAANAAIATAHANEENASAALVRQQALIAQAKAVVDGDVSQVEFAQHELERYQNLARQGAGTLQNFQQAKNRLQTAKAQEAEHRAAINAVTKQIDVLDAQHNATRADVMRAEAMQQRATLNLSNTTLLAPFDGVIGRRSLRVGAYVKPGDLLMAVVPVSQAYIIANFQESQLTHIVPGQSATVTVDTFPGEQLKGTVQSIAPATGVTFAAVAPDNATGNFTKVVQRIPVKIVLDANQSTTEQLRVGMSVEASVNTEAPNAKVGTR